MDPGSTPCWHEQKRGNIDAKITELIVKKENLRQEEMQIEEKLEKIEDFRFSNKQMPLVVSKALENQEIQLDELHDDLTVAKHHLQKEILGLIDKLEEVSEHGREDGCPCTSATKNSAWNKR